MLKASSKIFEKMVSLLQIDDRLTHLSAEVKVLVSNFHDLDKRVIRLETFIEIAQNQRKIAQLQD